VEFGLGLFILLFLFWVDRRLGREKRPRGVLSALFLLLYFLGRFLVEFIKERQGLGDDLFLSKGQILSIPGLLLGLVLLYFCLKHKAYDPAPKKGKKKLKSSADKSSNKSPNTSLNTSIDLSADRSIGAAQKAKDKPLDASQGHPIGSAKPAQKRNKHHRPKGRGQKR
jgi:hypothetical protein